MLKKCILGGFTLVMLFGTVRAEEGNNVFTEKDRLEGAAAVERSSRWLLEKQDPGGWWSNKNSPGLTGLALWALVNADCKDTNAMDKAVSYILSCSHKDGSFWCESERNSRGAGLPNYNTAVCMVALHATGKAELVPYVQKAREYMSGVQNLNSGDDYYGGYGYYPDPKRSYADLSNSYMAFEAMRITQDVEDLRTGGAKRVDLDWKAAEAFIQNVQNDSTINTNAVWAANEPPEKGGFAYTPKMSRGGARPNKSQAMKMRSMPGMTYAGMLSYIYADVDRSDTRVKVAFQWISNHWDLEASTRDPDKIAAGQGAEGLYYMYNVMSKGLRVYGKDSIQPDSGEAFDWRKVLAMRLVNLQKKEGNKGYWLNPVGRFWEGDPVLVTAYSMIALENALQSPPSK